MNEHPATVHTEASPSLALIKYWGKIDGGRNLAATPSLAVTLSGLLTRTAVRLSTDRDTVRLDGVEQPAQRYREFFENLRTVINRRTYFDADSSNTFPTAAGLASSSSGFAALALGCCAAAGADVREPVLSGLARIGSGSAARSVYGGFTVLPDGAESAHQIRPAAHWPDLRVVIVMTTEKRKPVSSRDAMNHTALTSPYYRAWTADAHQLLKEGVEAVELRDMEKLGRVIRLSYLRMFGTMISSDPPVLYWLPDSVGLIHLCETLRKKGYAAWETMDAGPQVKILTEARDLDVIVEAVREYNADLRVLIAGPGEGARTVGPDKDIQNI
jgi:diphosphomevalonate decarboxylase